MGSTIVDDYGLFSSHSQTIIKFQDELNKMIMPYYAYRLTTEDYNVAIFDELNELLSSGRNWKWWKHGAGNVDTWNEAIEIADVLHFVVSQYIMDNNGNSEYLRYFYRTHYQTFTPIPLIPVINNDGSISTTGFMNVVRFLTKNEGFDKKVVFAAVHLPNLFEISVRSLIATFYAKCALNAIRSMGGYNDPDKDYSKIVNGVEDNQLLEPIVKQNENELLSIASTGNSLQSVVEFVELKLSNFNQEEK